MGSLMSLVRKEGHSVFFIDNYLKPSRFIEEGFLERNNIEIICLHANTICFRDTLRVCAAIEELRAKGKWRGRVVVGGPHASVAPETIPESVDNIVLGEGENAILGIMNSVISERVIRCERITDLDSLPMVPWDTFSALPYDYSCNWLDTRPIYTMNTSRGCPFNCAFCSVASIWGRKYAALSPERIIFEIEYLLKEHAAKGIYFREDNFTLNRNRTEEFCRGVIRKHLNIQWACETRVDTLCDEDLVKLMSNAGCRAVYLGVESGSPRMLEFMNKGISVEQIRKAVNLCKKYDIRTYCSMIAGLPSETYEDYKMSKRLMRELKPYAVSYNVYVGIPVSSLYEYILQNKIYEFIDDVGLVYLPGYDVKAKFFYGLDSRELVDYEFKQKTDYERKLLKLIKGRERGIRARKRLVNTLPEPVYRTLRAAKRNYVGY